jgi:hypothetical protein
MCQPFFRPKRHGFSNCRIAGETAAAAFLPVWRAFWTLNGAGATHSKLVPQARGLIVGCMVRAVNWSPYCAHGKFVLKDRNRIWSAFGCRAEGTERREGPVKSLALARDGASDDNAGDGPRGETCFGAALELSSVRRGSFRSCAGNRRPSARCASVPAFSGRRSAPLGI